MDHPEWVADSWSAAALLGILAFDDGQDARMIRRHRKNTAPSNPLQPAVTGPSTGMTLQGATIAPHQALIRCLQQMDFPWFVHPVPGLADDTVRAVQVIDAFRRAGVGHTSVAAAARNTFDARRLARLWKLSDDGADSKPETTLRLVIRQVAPSVKSQVALHDEFGSIVTIFDLTLEELKIGIMYDGVVHWGRGNRAKDLVKTNEAHRLGWLVLRVGTDLLKNPRAVEQQVPRLMRQRNLQP